VMFATGGPAACCYLYATCCTATTATAPRSWSLNRHHCRCHCHVCCSCGRRCHACCSCNSCRSCWWLCRSAKSVTASAAAGAAAAAGPATRAADAAGAATRAATSSATAGQPPLGPTLSNELLQEHLSSGCWRHKQSSTVGQGRAWFIGSAKQLKCHPMPDLHATECWKGLMFRRSSWNHDQRRLDASAAMPFSLAASYGLALLLVWAVCCAEY
jgi:hypothetical protein